MVFSSVIVGLMISDFDADGVSNLEELLSPNDFPSNNLDETKQIEPEQPIAEEPTTPQQPAPEEPTPQQPDQSTQKSQRPLKYQNHQLIVMKMVFQI